LPDGALGKRLAGIRQVLRLSWWRQILPVCIGFTVIVGLIIPGSDHPIPSLVLTCVSGGLAAFSWAFGGARFRSARHKLLFNCVLGSFIAVLGIVSFQAILMWWSTASDASTDVSALIIEGLKLCGIACAFLAALRLGNNGERAALTINLLACGVTVWAGVCLMAACEGPQGAWSGFFLDGRLKGALTSPNSAGTLFCAFGAFQCYPLLSYFAGTLTPAVTGAKSRLTTGTLALRSLCLLICLSATFATKSRGAVFCFLVVVVSTAFFTLWRRPARLAVVLGGIVSLAVALVMVSPSDGAQNRYQTIADDIATRSVIYEAHLSAALKKPLLGYGLGSFNAVNNSILDSDNYPELSVIRAAHNVYLQWFEAVGGLGLAAICVVNLAIFASIFCNRGEMPNPVLVGSVCAAYAVFLLHGLVDYGFQEPALCFAVAVMLGIAAGQSLFLPDVTPSERRRRSSPLRRRRRSNTSSSEGAEIEINNHIFKVRVPAIATGRTAENLSIFRDRLDQLQLDRASLGNGDLFLSGAVVLVEEVRALELERDALRLELNKAHAAPSAPTVSPDAGARLERLYGRSKKTRTKSP